MNIIQKIKRLKLYFYTTNVFQYLLPKVIFQTFLKSYLAKAEQKKQFLNDRIAHYISPSIHMEFSENWIALKDYKIPKKSTIYFFDLYKIAKYFPTKNRINYKFGDVTENFEQPTIVKSRPIAHNGNSVVMKLDVLRHFNFIKDHKSFEEKSDLIVWRGEIHKENRRLLVEKYHDHECCDIGEVRKNSRYPSHWQKGFLTPKEQFNYKFIVSIEGIDVATNLKWIMNSNSLCFMPKPKYETWFMEGLLKPNFHYVLLQDDYSDLIEKRNYYLEHVDEAKAIIKNAQEWTAQFKDLKNEKLLSIAVLNKFFQQTKQS